VTLRAARQDEAPAIRNSKIASFRISHSSYVLLQWPQSWPNLLYA
jgi:hypothetical protein